MTVDYRVGDTTDLVRDLPDGSVSMVACSPPFIALRSYGFDLDARNRDLYPARREECARALFGTEPELPGQASLFEGVA